MMIRVVMVYIKLGNHCGKAVSTPIYQIADWMAAVLTDISDEAVLSQTRTEVETLCASFPLYEELARHG